MPLIGLLLCVAGFASMALAMSKHQREVLGRVQGPGRQMALRLGGWGLLCLALWLCLETWGVSIGLVSWTGLLTVAAIVVVLTLTYLPRAAGR